MTEKRREVAETWVLVKNNDRIQVTIFDDGTTKQEVVGAVSSVNHGTADSLVTLVARTLGGTIERLRTGHKVAVNVVNGFKVERRQ